MNEAAAIVLVPQCQVGYDWEMVRSESVENIAGFYSQVPVTMGIRIREVCDVTIVYHCAVPCSCCGKWPSLGSSFKAWHKEVLTQGLRARERDLSI